MSDLDTAQKRGSSVQVLAPWQAAPPIPTGTIDAGERQHIAYSYALASAAPGPPPPPTGCALDYFNALVALAPAAIWRFDETAGSTLFDSSGNNNNGTLHGGITLGQTGPVPDGSSKSALFDGLTGYVDLFNLPALHVGAGSFTLAYWINASDVGAPNIWCDYESTDAGGVGIGYQTYHIGIDGIEFSLSHGNNQQVVSSAVDDTWHFVVHVLDRGTGALSSYLDGHLVANSNLSTVDANLTPSTDLAAIGVYSDSAFPPAGNDHLAGSLSGMALFKSALTNAQILTLYDLGQCITPPPPTPTPPAITGVGPETEKPPFPRIRPRRGHLLQLWPARYEYDPLMLASGEWLLAADLEEPREVGMVELRAILTPDYPVMLVRGSVGFVQDEEALIMLLAGLL